MRSRTPLKITFVVEMKGYSTLGVIDGYCAIYQIVLWFHATASILMVYLRQGLDQCRQINVKGWFAVFVSWREPTVLFP